MEVLTWAIMWFEVVSGLKINLHKSELIPVGVVPNFKDLDRVLGCKMGYIPSCYLGLLLGAAFKSSRVWEVIKERFQKRLALWKKRDLSKERRLTLVKSTLSSLPIYFMSLFILPHKISLRLEKIQRDFL